MKTGMLPLWINTSVETGIAAPDKSAAARANSDCTVVIPVRFHWSAVCDTVLHPESVAKAGRILPKIIAGNATV